MQRSAVVGLILLALVGPVRADSLAIVEDVSWRPFRSHCRELLAALEKLSAPLPGTTLESVKALLDSGPRDQRAASAAIQKLLDPHCLVGVHINPESRVKAARGQRRAHLVLDQTALVLVKVHNEAGVRHGLLVKSDQAIVPGKKEADRWVEASIVKGSFAKGLTGRRLEYRLLRLTARQSGKREATLAFDVGQGTQDLGFRAEVPILFTIAKAR
jgi:hypothetical protein